MGTFYPSEQNEDRHRPMALVGDVTLVISVVAGGILNGPVPHFAPRLRARLGGHRRAPGNVISRPRPR